MAYLRISLVVAALLAAMGVAGFNARNGSSAAPGARNLGESTWDSGNVGGEFTGEKGPIICTGCN